MRRRASLTLPAPIAAVAFANKAPVYDLLFKAAAETVTTVAADPGHLGARVGLPAVLHTWGSALNHIKACKTHLAADRTSCTRAVANQFRLFLHAGAYWLLWGLRAAMPKRFDWRVARFNTMRLCLIKVAARVVEMRRQIRVHLPTTCPAQTILRLVLTRIPRLAT